MSTIEPSEIPEAEHDENSESCIEEVLRKLDKARNRLAGKAADDLETFRMHREILAEVATDLARLISGQEEKDPAVQQLADLAKSLSDHCFTVGAFGTTAAGKSTLVNALVASTEDRLLEGLGRTSLVVTRIEKPGEEYPHDSCVLSYKSREEVIEQIEELLKVLDIEPEEIPKDRRLDDPSFREWLNGQVTDVLSFKEDVKGEAPSLAVREAANSLTHFLEGWDECREFLADERCFATEQRQEAESFIHKPNYKHACYVAERILYHDNRLTTEHDIQLIDSPGVSANAFDTLRAVNIARKSDAFAMVTSVDFQFMQADRDFLEALADSLQGDRRKKLIFVLNKIQEIDPEQCTPPVTTLEEATRQQEDRLREKLADYLFEDVHVLSVDARCGKIARRLKEIPEGEVDEKLKARFDRVKFPGVPSIEENLALSGIEKFEDDLVSILLNLKYNHDVSEQVSRIEKSVADYKDNLQKLIDDFHSTVEDIEKELSEHGNRKKLVERTLLGYHQELKKKLEKEVYWNRGQKCNQLIKEFVDDLSHRISEALKHHGGLGNTANIVNGALEDSKPLLQDKIRNLRKDYERQYDEIKTEAIEKEIPDIMKAYGEDVSWDLELKDLDEADRTVLEGSLPMLDLNFFQILKANLKALVPDMFAWIFGNGDQEKFRWHIIEYIRENEGAFNDAITHHMVQWIDDDREGFEEQTTEHFLGLMDDIYARILLRVEEKKKWRTKEKKRQVVLDRFHKASEEILKKLSEVRKATADRAPSEDQ